MKNIYKYILLSIISGITLIPIIQNSVKADQNILPVNVSQNTINTTEDLPILKSPIAKNVYDTAKSITVMIQGKSGDAIRVGSGVIIAKNGDTYYVLTAEHVFRGLLEPKIITPDGKVYPIKINEKESQIADTDLGVLEFSSKENYQVATFANSQVKDRDIVFTYGFPREEIIKGNNRGLFSIGFVWSQEQSIGQASNSNVFFNQGYELAYSNLTAVGVSGGPVLDHQGRLVGIHGRADGDWEEVKSDQMIQVQVGYSIGIPSGYLFGDLVKEKNWKTYLKQDKGKTTVLSTDTKNELLETVAKSFKVPTENNAFAWLNYGNQLWRYIKYELAIDAFEKAISLESDLYYAYYAKGSALYELGKYQEAITILEKGINIYNQTSAKDKKFIIACLDWQGRSLIELKKYEEALKVYEQAIQLDTSENAKNRNFLLFFQKATLLYKLKRYEQVIPVLSEAIKVKPNHNLAYYNRGLTYYNLKEYNKAISDFNQTIFLNPQSAEAHYNRGLIYGKLKEYNKALSDFNQTISLNPQSAEAYNNRGYIYDELKEYDKAISDYSQAISLNPQSFKAYSNRGVTYDNLKEHDKAISDYSQAISINPQDVVAYNNRGFTHYELKEYEKAISDYNQAITLNPQYAQAYYNRGVTYEILGERQKAINDLEKAREIFCQQGSPYCEATQELLQQLKQQ